MTDLLSLFVEAVADWTGGDGRGARYLFMVVLLVWAVIALFNGSTTSAIVAFAIDFVFLLVELRLRRNARARKSAI